jgi:protein-S-isoprenylcysteine O-methyltransferase Ste14
MLLLLKNILFTLIVPGTAGVYVPLRLAHGRAPASGQMLFLALVLLAAGGVIYVWCVWNFAVIGRGTPAPIDAPKKLVVRGPYRYSRNPMYTGALTVILGWTVMFRAMNLLIYMICVGIFFHLFVVFYEEPHLTRLFGDEYREYCDKVNRWLPRLRR